MSKKTAAVEEPEIIDEEGEESDDYDDIEEDEEDVAEVEDEEQDGEDDEGLTEKGKSLTALLLGGEQESENEEDEDEDEDDEDNEFTPNDTKGPATEVIASAPAPSVGTKRTRPEDEPDGAEELSGDYGEFEENGESVKKKARAAAEDEA
ncbi:hypothetical protein BC835DRAFT_1423294 [Cytidiella melzeri]|nr:hypothetical protein BC835DRAFT_1423294 [Cytidiella melzeri]